ncbi:hypothetical protein HPP92_007390 [Vanilla planifolia]|uniref:BHLH domain-containing protein n=1 Tax=Vanilla planifolia TaxID=51239 RepID=A0A835RGI8_VANPL|nr:hypothetical protein HPP92_007390 [Vanilla planifolia]
MTVEGLREFCRGGGWTFGGVWRINLRDPRLLMLEETYHDEQSGKIFEKMISRVHVLGQGMIGEIALSGKHRWITFDALSDGSEISTILKLDICQGGFEQQYQILAEIKTVAIFPLLPLGMILISSTQKICENSIYVRWARQLLGQIGLNQQGRLHIDLNSSHPQATSAYLFSSLTSSFKNNISDHISAFNWQQNDDVLSESLPSASELSHGSCVIARSQASSLEPITFSMPIASTSSGSINSLGSICHEMTSFSSISSCQVTDQQTAITESQALFSPINMSTHSKCKFPSNIFTNYYRSMTLLNEGNPSDYMDHKLLPVMAASAVPIPATLHSYVPNSSNFSLVNDDSVFSKSKVCPFKGLLDTGSVYGSVSHFPVCDLASSIYPSQDFPFVSEGVKLNNSPLIFSNRESPNHHIHVQSMNNQVQSFELRSDQESNVLSTLVSCNLPDVSNTSSSMIGNICAAHADDNLFDGMELDFSPINLEQGWDDITTQDCVSEIEVGSAAVAFKDLFLGSCFEQLLDSAAAGNAKLTSTCDIFSSINSGDCEDLRNHLLSTSEVSNAQHKLPNGSAKVVRRRARRGESTRRRPKDRQQIQDRVKELREIVPNGAKCSIDALLDRTIKHLLFLQSVTKYAEKLNQTDEPKIIGEEDGVVLKDYINGEAGGATWAYEVAGQTMFCPILVEDINPSGQMHVEMLCEERGFFLEIADVVRGFGLTILKGFMEIRETKIWARFIVEAQREITRMDVFLSLVHLLQQSSSRSDILMASRPPPAPSPIGLADGLL